VSLTSAVTAAQRAEGLAGHEGERGELNPAGLSAAGYSLLDAVRDTELPYAVVHISQWHAIDAEERTAVFAGTAVYVAGAGWRGYSMALEAIVHQIRGD
jgi:3-dehydroquinate dehydratase-2